MSTRNVATTLLDLPVCVEPDRRRLARFTVDAVRTLGGSEFAAAGALVSVLEELRALPAERDSAPRAILSVEEEAVVLAWPGGHRVMSRLAAAPAREELEALAAHLRQVSESVDPELLLRRNQQFAAELEQAKQRAAHEMAELEADLERKKRELQSSIRKAETDSLTGLLNRGAYDSRLHEALRYCGRQGEPLTLLLLDLDYFKQINDTHGHQYGDQYLRDMAGVMRASIREHVDVPCRIGGDEFAILVYGDRDAGNEVAQRVLAGMQGKVSIGVGQMCEGDTVETLVGRTDAALYDAKSQGRGCISCGDRLGTWVQEASA